MANLETYRAEVLRMAEGFGATNVRVASFEDPNDPAGDLALIVDMDPERSLFDLVDLGRALTDLLGRQVDVLATASLNPRLRDQVLAGARAL